MKKIKIVYHFNIQPNSETTIRSSGMFSSIHVLKDLRKDRRLLLTEFRAVVCSMVVFSPTLERAYPREVVFCRDGVFTASYPPQSRLLENSV